ncbi:MAG TPA: hypothetical protein VHD32_13915 [Candidatus Didemnitutus sp.]|nr:hypothetical protein [Candidatus Didemnitutus sp.]
MLSDLFNRGTRRSLLVEINSYQTLVASFSQSGNGTTLIESAGEFANQDEGSLREWLDGNFEKRKTWVPAICSYVSPEMLLQRESIQPRKLTEPDYLTNLVREQFKIENPESWKLKLLSPVEGTPIPPEGSVRPALICGMANAEVHQVQQRMLDFRLMPYRLEPGLVPLLGALSERQIHSNDKRAVVVVIIEQEHTLAVILGKEGVHTPTAVSHGFSSIVQSAAKEFAITDDAEIRHRLHHPDDEVMLRATKFVRAIGRELKPVIDSYEMTTGQPVGEIFCAYLPTTLAWIAEPLALVMGRTASTFSCREWMPGVGIEVGPNVPELGPHWIGPLSLLAGLTAPKGDSAPPASTDTERPWHVDVRLSGDLPNTKLVGKRFFAGTLAGTLAALAATGAVLQVYQTRSYEADTVFWQAQMAEKQKLFDDLQRDSRVLSQKTARLDFAYNLMNPPYEMSAFVLNLGRTLPPHMRITRIEGSDARVVINGALREPSEEASRTLGRYLDELRHAPAIGPLFTSIGLTAMQREEDADTLSFEITFKLKTAP